MTVAVSQLTVLFEDPFWVGVYERQENGRYQVCKIIFGAQPSDAQVYALLLSGWRRLCFGPPVRAEAKLNTSQNPKRSQRQAARQTQPSGIGTKAQQALATQREEQKQARGEARQERRREEEQRRFAERAQKRKEKHRGH